MEQWQLLTRIGKGILHRRKPLAVSIFLVSFIVLEFISYNVSWKPPRYKTSATIMLQVNPYHIPLFAEWLPWQPFPVQLTILQSRSLTESVLQSLPKTAVEDLLKNPYHTDYGVKITNFFRRLAGTEPVVYSPNYRALQELRLSRISFVPKNDGMVEIHADASNPQVAVDLVNTYIDALITRTRSFNIEDARNVREFLEQQLADAKEDLKPSEDALTAFSRARVATVIPERYREAVTRLSSLEASLAEVQTNKRITQTRLVALRQKVDAQKSSAPPSPSSPPQPIQTSTITVSTLYSRLAQLESQLLDLQGKYTDQHPRIVQVKEQIDDTRRRILALLKETSEITPIRGAVEPTERVDFANQLLAIEGELIALKAQEEALQTQIPLVKRALSGLSTDQLEYSRLLGDTERKRRLHALLLEKLNAARMREQGGMQVVKVIDPPSYPLSSTGNWSLRLFAMAAALALALGIVIPGLVEYILMPVGTEDDVSASMDLPVLGVIPLLRKSAFLPAPEIAPQLWSRPTDLPDRRFATVELEKQQEELWVFIESFRGIRTAVQMAMRERPIRSILVISTHPKEGKSTVIFNLGMAFWEAGKRVILADADFYQPTLQKALRVPAGQGLTDLLRGESELTSTLVPVADRFWVSGLGSSVPAQSRTMLATTRVREVIEEMTGQADLVLFDSSPLFIIPDNLFLASSVDAVFLVAKAGETRLRDLARAKAMLEKAGGNIIGVVINQAPVGSLRSYYKYYKHYYKSYVKESTTS